MHSVVTPRTGLAASGLENMLLNPLVGAHRLSFPARTLLYGPVDRPETIYFIHQGQVRTYQPGPNHSRRLLEILGPGEWCGVAALAELSHYGEGAEAVLPTIVSAVAVERLIPFLVQHRTVAIDLMKQLAGKLTRSREEAAGLVFEDCNRRLVRTLLRLSKSPAASPGSDGVVLHITHQQLAQVVGVARETVTLALAQLRRRNLLRTGRNRLIFNPSTLQGVGEEPAAPVAAQEPVAEPQP